MPDFQRRYLLAGLLALALALSPVAVLAKDGDSGGGGNSGSGSSGGGGNGGDDSDEDNDSDDDNDDDGDNSSGGSSKGKKRSDQERALKAVKSGKVVSLQELKSHLKSKYPGRLLKVDLKQQMGRFVYRVKILQEDNRVKSLTLDGLTLQARGF